jgi:hypothetical protein
MKQIESKKEDVNMDSGQIMDLMGIDEDDS